MTAIDTREREPRGLGGRRYSERRQKWVGTFELPPDPQTGRRRRKEVSADTEEGVIAAMDRAKELARRGLVNTTRNRGTLEEYLEKWLVDIFNEGTRPSTVKSYRGVVRNHVVPHIGTKKLIGLSTEDIRHMKARILESSTASRARYAHVVLTKALQDAVNDERIPRNVALLVKKQTVIAAPVEALTALQSKKVIVQAVKSHDPYASRWATGLMTGARQGEILGMTWDRVDLDAGRMLFEWQLQLMENVHGCQLKADGTYSCGHKFPRHCHSSKMFIPEVFDCKKLHGALYLTRPKTEMSKRWTSIPPQLVSALKVHKMNTAHIPNPHQLVWTTDKGFPIIPRADYDNWHKALDAAGVPRTGVHSSRHTTATLLKDLKVDKRVIQSILGHTQATTTAGYIHIAEAEQADAMRDLGMLLEGFELEPDVIEQLPALEASPL